MEEVGLHRPGEGDPLLAAAARAAARSRVSLRGRFPDREAYARAFVTLHPGAALVATHAGALAGVMLLRRDGQDPYDLSPVAELCGWWPTLRHRTLEWLTSGRDVHIAAFWVLPALRDRGIGGRMLTALCEGETDDITLLARRGREGFYARHGFRKEKPGRLRLAGQVAGMTAMRRKGRDGEE